MGTQALFYYLIKHFVHDYNIINSFINVPLVKPFIYFYGSWYPFILLSTFIVYKNDNKLFHYMIISMLLGALMSQITFILYPSMIIRPNIEVHNITDWILNFTYISDDPPINCLPSMHCVYCFVTSFFILKCDSIKTKYKLLFAIYSFLIVISTVFVKQHVIEDVILAFIYTVIVLFIVHLNKERINKLFNKIKL